MSKCIVCHNEYDKTFDIIFNSQTYTFDSFECAIHKLAPQCSACGCKILGHGIEGNGLFYCCANCARRSGVNAVDRL